jgi:hypothetical protein
VLVVGNTGAACRESKDVSVVQSEIAKEISDEIQSALGEHRPIAPVACS